MAEACRSSSFCLKEEKKEDIATYNLKKKHDYFYQVQCQMYCVNKECCDFVVQTEKDMHIERILQR